MVYEEIKGKLLYWIKLVQVKVAGDCISAVLFKVLFASLILSCCGKLSESTKHKDEIIHKTLLG